MKVVYAPNSAGCLSHGLSTDGPRDVWRTWCGKQASDWNELEETTEAKFMEGVWSCRRCVAALRQ